MSNPERYRGDHRTRRREWAQRIANGQRPPCARCGIPIDAGDDWHLDHTDDGTDYLGPSHARCNERAGGRKAQRLRRARRITPRRPRSQNW